MIENTAELRKNVGFTKLHRLANYKQRRQIADLLLGNDLKEDEMFEEMQRVLTCAQNVETLTEWLENIQKATETNYFRHGCHR